MSVDVFGRQLNQAEGVRGPPGIGYKITKDGQYDLENKRLCNLAQPINFNDAVNLETLQNKIEAEVQRVLKPLRKKVKNLTDIFDLQKIDIYSKIKNLIEVFDLQKNDINDKIKNLIEVVDLQKVEIDNKIKRLSEEIVKLEIYLKLQ